MFWTDYIVIGIGIVIALLGFLGVLNKSRKGQRIAKLLGEFGARIFYIILGAFLIAMSLLT